MDISTTLLSTAVAAQPTSQHMGNGVIGSMWMGMHWGWWLMTVLILALLVAFMLRLMGRGPDDS